MQTTTKQSAVIIGVAVVISFVILVINTGNKHPAPAITYKTFYQPSGWGYEILENNKIFIHQDFVPVLSGEKGFSKKEYAEQAARLVVEKIQQNQLPTLTKNELTLIGPVNTLLYEQPASQ